MPENINRTKGRSAGYKFDRGGTPTEFGPFIGIVVNNVDPARSGRLQVWIQQFGATDPDGAPLFSDESTWRTVNYVPPFYGMTPHTGTNAGAGTFTGNDQSYGMWFTPPDLYTQVICFFVGGDPNQGYYIGCVPEPAVNHMLPAVGASRRYQLQNGPQDSYYQGVSQLPVTEINTENEQIYEDPRFFDRVKPVHSYVAGLMLQQGLIRDTVRGPITSNAQRESPSAVFGISTPGQAIYQGGLNERDIRGQLERGQLRPQDVEVIARRGGHTLVMDDGDLEGRDNLVRIRTSKGHQITMSDDGDCFYIIHANGQTWLEFGKQGTVDVFSTNSVNIRTQGTINLHADKEINMYAGLGINAKTKVMKIEAESTLDIIGTGKLTMYSKNFVGVKSDGSLAMRSATGSWDAGANMSLEAGCINLNSGGGAPVPTPTPIKDFNLADTRFVPEQGWESRPGTLKTIVTRAPTHEPYPYHNQGVNSLTTLGPPESSDLSTDLLGVLAGLADVPVIGGLDISALSLVAPAELSIGSLDLTQVTSLLAQTALDVGQPANIFTPEKGIGLFGFNPGQLETAGFLKPGTLATYLQDPSKLASVLNSPQVWTGKSGISNLGSLLGDVNLQSLTQNEILDASLRGLQSAGVVTGRENPQDLAALVQTAARFGVDDAVAWVRGQAPADVAAQISSVAKNAQYAVNFVNEKASELTTGINLGGFVNTVERSAVDQAVTQVIGDSKIPTPIFSSSLFGSTPTSDLTYDTNIGDDLKSLIDSERIARGLSSLIDPVTGAIVSQSSTVVDPRSQSISRLLGEISSLESSIRTAEAQRRDTTVLYADLRRLQSQLATLQNG